MAKGRGTVLPLPDGIPERLVGGYKNELLRFGDVVLRLTKAPREAVAWAHALLATLPPPAVAPLAGPGEWEEGRTASLFPSVHGRRLGDEVDELAAYLASLHAVPWDGPQCPTASSWAGRDLVQNAWWDWRIVEKPPVLVRAYEETARFLADPPPFRVGVVHGDVHPTNVLVDGGRIAGVVDWQEARLDWQAAELANAAWVFGTGFVDAYVRAGGPAETDRLAELIRLRNVADVLDSLTSKARGEPYSEAHVDRLLAALA